MRVLSTIVVVALALGACRQVEPTKTPATATAPASALSAPEALQPLLERELAGMTARTGVYVKHLGTGEEAGVRADQAFNSFSVIKLAILLRAYALAEAGRLNLDERVLIAEDDLRDGSGIFYTFDPGLRVTLRDLLTQMIITSDNTGTDLMLARVGGLSALNAWLKEQGFGQTAMVQEGADLFRIALEVVDPKYRSLSPSTVFAYMTYPYLISQPRAEAQAKVAQELQKAVPLTALLPKLGTLWSDDRRYWLGSMTPRETARLLEAIERGTMASAASTEQMKHMLLEQREGRLRLPHYLQWPDYFVGHKTGDGPPVIANDVGIVYGPSGPVVISFFSAANTGPYAELEDRIGHLARAVTDYFERQR